ncbi:hypothetical protein JDS93_26880 [Bacillus cereus group sp. N34]|nr:MULTISPECIES: hypothetical protein [Bacillus cereus group]MBJ8019629.1 hypothetical protein [Bacillus cereus group sp. N34]
MMKLFFILSAISLIILTALNKVLFGIVLSSLFFILALFFSKPRFTKK